MVLELNKEIETGPVMKMTVLHLDASSACFWLAARVLFRYVVEFCYPLINDDLGCCP